MNARSRPIIVWFRRDLRLADHVALTEAAAQGHPILPVFLCDETVEKMGAAAKWRLGLSVQALAGCLEARGARLVLRRAPALDGLRALIDETNACAVYWTRCYDPDAIARDTQIKAALPGLGVEAKSFPGHVLFEPWEVATGQGGPYRVYTPFWKAVRDRHVAAPLPEPKLPQSPEGWPKSDELSDWGLGRAMRRGAQVVAPWLCVGESAAAARLERFADEKIQDYAALRDFPAEPVTSSLSENLAWGEISAARCWRAGQRALEQGADGAEKFLKELVWRDFAYHLMFHTPWIATGNWRKDWDAFPWRQDAHAPEVEAWRRGRTGTALVDAGMREMYVTGRMHNRVRMIVASYLTKHLMTHWKIGMDWFADCLVDWDPASNAMGWQWVAGSGPDAAPFFRIFNPDSQAARYDPHGRYVDKWVVELSARRSEAGLSYFDAIPKHWALTPDSPYPDPIVCLKTGREAALSAYAARGF